MLRRPEECLGSAKSLFDGLDVSYTTSFGLGMFGSEHALEAFHEYSSRRVARLVFRFRERSACIACFEDAQ